MGKLFDKIKTGIKTFREEEREKFLKAKARRDLLKAKLDKARSEGFEKEAVKRARVQGSQQAQRRFPTTPLQNLLGTTTQQATQEVVKSRIKRSRKKKGKGKKRIKKVLRTAQIKEKIQVAQRPFNINDVIKGLPK